MIADILQTITREGEQQRLVEMGKIKIGGREAKLRSTAGGGTWRAPEKYDHFVITTMSRDAKGDLIPDKALMDDLAKKYGDADGKLRRIPIRVLSDDIDDIVQSAFVWYGGKNVGARSDGKKVTWFNSPNAEDFGKKYPEPIEQTWEPSLLDSKSRKTGLPLFKVHTAFNCVIAAQEARWGGVYKFRTTSIISLKQLYASLLHLSQLTGGILSGMPLMLVVRPMNVAPPGKDGKPVQSTIHVVHVELHGPDLMALQTQAMAVGDFRVKFADRIQDTTRQYRKLLAGPGTESDIEAKDISDEFAPENVTEIETLPPDATYGLLDGPEPGEDLAADVAKKDSATGALPAATKTADPEPATTAVPTKRPDSAPQANADNEADEISEWLDRPWDDVKEALYYKAALVANHDLPREHFENGLARAVLILRRKGRENDITQPKRREFFDAMKAGRFDFSTGRIAATASAENAS